MALDIYSKQKELQQKIQEQQQRLANVGTKRNAYYDQQRDYRAANQGKNSQEYALANAEAESAAQGAQSAEKHAADVEIDKYQKQLDQENQRISVLKPFADLQGQQEMRAKQFRTAFPSILDSKLGTARTDMRRQIAEGVGNARAGYNSRGLLFSGLRAGAEGDVAADAENKLADTTVKTNQELNDQANQLDQDAIETGLAMGNVSKDLASTNEEYRKSLIDSLLQKDQARQQAIGGLLGTGAQIAGYGLGAATK